MMSGLGIDVGSTTAKVAVVAADGTVLHHAARRHGGRPSEVVAELLAGAHAFHDGGPSGATGSLGVAMAEQLGAVAVHEVHAMVLAARQIQPGARSLVELGGQDAKVVLLDPARPIADAEMNERCAAGTGATLDRIARRLGITTAELAAARLQGQLSVAAKCGVFAETDAINLIKRGATSTEVLSALARAIVAQNVAVLTRGRVLRPPVVLLGGPHAHLPVLADAWRERLGQLWMSSSASPEQVQVPRHAMMFPAIGAALHALHGGRPLAVVRGVLGGRERRLPPLGGCTPRATLATQPVPSRLTSGEVRAHLGIDAGSTTSKVVLLDDRGNLVWAAYGASCGNPLSDARRHLTALRDEARHAGSRLRIVSTGVTGYGAEVIGPVWRTDAAPVETLAHAEAATRQVPDVDVVVDVGGTDVKVLRLKGGRVVDFFVSNQCAAGHGAFVESVAADLGIPLDRFADEALGARRAPRFTVGCAVFLDTDRVTFQRDGYTPAEILAGLAWSLARNVWEFVVPVRPERLGRRFLLTGGVHRNLAAAQAQARYLADRVPDAHVSVHPHPGLCGAIGAALAGRRATRAGTARTTFVGLEAALRMEVAADAAAERACGRCELACRRSILEVAAPDRPPRFVVLGHTCERGASVSPGKHRTRAHAPDLLDAEARRLVRRLLPPPRAVTPRPRAPVFGIPRVMGLYRSAPLLLHYLRAAGVPEDHLVLSPPTSESLYREGARWGANDPCFPAKLVQSHVDWLLRLHESRPLDVMLMPVLTHASIAVEGTADTASCPIVAACGPACFGALRRDGDVLAQRGIRPLAPSLCLVDRDRLERDLFAAFGPLLGLSEEENSRALAHGLAAQRAFLARGRRRAQKLLAKLTRVGRAAAVVLARPYHADPGVQHGLSTELAARGIPVLSITSLPIGEEDTDLGDLFPFITNSGCAEKLWAARIVAARPHLLAVDLSSFRCGQDASIAGTLSDLLGGEKPFLRLHDMDEDRPGASLRMRIETFVASVRGYERSRLQRKQPPPSYAEVRP